MSHDRLSLITHPQGEYQTWGYSQDEKPPFDLKKVTEETVRQSFSSAGVLPLSPDQSQVLLGGHKIPANNSEGFTILWGPFAGGRESDEEPEQTAQRETYEELTDEKIELLEPVVIINATRPSNLKFGVIFPIILDTTTRISVPNEEISDVRWFTWDGIMQLMDEYDPTYHLWGGLYTQMLLDEWIRAYSTANKRGYNGPAIAELMHGVICIEQGLDFPDIAPYHKFKQAERQSRK